MNLNSNEQLHKDEARNQGITRKQIARMIDHTLLKADASKEQIVDLCKEAVKYQFATVCVNPTWVKTAATGLKGENVGVTTVIGFPLGATTTFTKMAETKDAIASGATEIDMVMNIGALKSGNYELVQKDIESVVLAARGQVIVKVIIETCFLTNEEKVIACEIAKEAGAHFVKTSTGFGTGGATVEDITLMRKTVGPDFGVKASGGVRDYQTALRMIRAGATRIGASSGKEIVNKSGNGKDY